MKLKTFTFILLTLCSIRIYGQTTIKYLLPTSQQEKKLKENSDKKWTKAINFYLSPKQLAALTPISITKNKKEISLEIPLNEHETAQFSLVSSDVLPPKLLKKYPQFRTYKGLSKNGNAYAGRFSLTKKGFQGIIDTPKGTYFLDPHPSGEEGFFKVYSIRQNRPIMPGARFACGHDHHKGVHMNSHLLEAEMLKTYQESARSKSIAWDLKEYKIAVACTGEYAQYHGGTVEDALSAIVLTINRLNMVTERDLGIQLILMEDNDQLIFTDPVTDPYTNGNSGEMLGQNINYMRVTLDQNSYDLGHVFGTNNVVSGVAYRGSVCINFISAFPEVNKGGGVSLLPEPEGDAFTIAVVGHEVGHQLGASHSFSSCQEVNAGTAFEPGGGTTIMAYAGICGQQINNLQFFTDDYYHTISLQQILFNTREEAGRFCGSDINTSNVLPEVDIPLQDGFYVPVSTPFKLDANAFDANGDTLTYCWEQYDLGPTQNPPGSPAGNSPLFRSFLPTEASHRYFPALEKIVFNQFDRSEVLPTYSRDLTFRCSVRDNNPEAGAAVWDQVGFKSTAEAGPFVVLTHSEAGAVWEAGKQYEVNWNVANTDGELVNCQHVNIRLSLDGGFTYPILLSENTPNDGSARVNIPIIESREARIMVEAADNVFFDLSTFNFEITTPASEGVFVNVTPASIQGICLPETATFQLSYQSILNYDGALQFNLNGELPEGTEVDFSNNNVQASEELSFVDLNINFPNTLNNEVYDLKVEVIAPGLDTIIQDIQVRTFSTNFSTLKPLSPVDGDKGLANQSVSFNWNGSANAESYQFEISTSPAFGEDIIFQRSQSDTSVQINNLLEPNTFYYWRLRPFQSNCGPGTYSAVNVFQTVTSLCNTYENDTPVNISGTGRPTIQSKITVPEGGAIEDVNIPIIEATYQPIKSLRISLISPTAQEAVLYNQECGNTVIFRTGFDDEALTTIECPPDDRLPFQPLDSLAAFNGETAAGEWTLQVQVAASGFGAAGALDKWSIEFCSQQVPIAPSLEINPLTVTKNGSGVINQALLAASDQKFSASDLTYVIINIPESGNLELNGVALQNGDTFTQIDVNNNGLSYQHNGDLLEEDQFIFIVRNPEGGWVGSEVFNISIDQPVSTANNQQLAGSLIKVYPNPANALLTIEANQPITDPVTLTIRDINGRLLSMQSLDGLSQEGMDTHFLAEGIYILQIQTQNSIYNQKIIINR